MTKDRIVDGEAVFFKEVMDAILTGGVTDKEGLVRLKLKTSRRLHLSRIPKNSEIRARLPLDVKHEFEHILRTKAVRSISGVTVVAAMTSPADCPHGKCIYCPGGVENDTAQSYTGREPASLRAANNGFDPLRQVSSRIEQLQLTGHSTDKIDLIIMGGTFTAREAGYQDRFVKGCFDAMNGRIAKDLEEALVLNETARNRCIGMTIETRPDHCGKAQIGRMRAQGATRVELGVQCPDDDIYARVKRGHTVADVVQATRLAKDAGMKVGYHMMPGLPGVPREGDIGAFKRLFEDPDLKPDMLKIYPTLVLKGTPLHEMWKRGEFTPPTTQDLVSLLSEVKAFVPPWVRIQRVQRDIPVQLIEAGVNKGNLRELVLDEMAVRGKACRCIRCREAGIRALKGSAADPSSVRMKEVRYDAAGGKEAFITWEDEVNDILISYLRLRLPGEWWLEGTEDSAFVREVKVIGRVVPIGGRARDGDDKAWQHVGKGKALIERAIDIARDGWGVGRLLVTSGVGAREYYRDLGFDRHGTYMGIRLRERV
jgi:elongator complex protein 3